MKFTHTWLRETLHLQDDGVSLDDRLLQLGLEVVATKDWSQILAPFRVAQILEVGPHPQADRLRLCTLCYEEEGGRREQRVVCGASNVRPNLKVIFAPEGATIPSTGLVLKAAIIRGVESCGMICSFEELGLDVLATGGDTIAELSPDAPLARSVAEVLALNDTLFQVEVTPNRPDLLGVQGIARELAATGVGAFKPADVTRPVFTDMPGISVHIEQEAEEACSCFALAEVRGNLSTKALPKMQARLAMTDLMMKRTEVSAQGDGLVAVDITNYVAFGAARPLHAFDAQAVQGDMRVRLARKDEQFEALNGQTYTLQGDELVIADDAGVISLAGVMGGARTAVTNTTTHFYIESASFAGPVVSQTARRLGLVTDASLRFERGVDSASTVWGVGRALQLLEEAGGQVVGATLAGQEGVAARFERTYDPACVARLAGLDVTREKQLERLTIMGFQPQDRGNEGIRVTVPSWRFDFEDDPQVFEANIAEEMVRLKGLNAIPAVPLPPPARKLKEQSENGEPLFYDVGQRARGFWASRGLDEVITWSFMGAKDAALFRGTYEEVLLQNPPSEDMGHMRPSLLPGLLRAISRHQARNIELGAGLLEIGTVYPKAAPESERFMAAAVMTSLKTPSWCGEAQDIWTLKGHVEAMLHAWGVPEEAVQFLQTREVLKAHGAWHTGQSAVLKTHDGEVLGLMGALHPGVFKHFEVEGPVFMAEIDLMVLSHLAMSRKQDDPVVLSPYQRVFRDLGLVVPRAVVAGAVSQAIKGAIGKALVALELFDVFDDHERLGADHKSLAFRLTLEPIDKPADEPWIEGHVDRALKALSTLGCRLRRDVEAEAKKSQNRPSEKK